MFSFAAVNAQQADANNKQKVINVNGTAEMEIVPDEIYVQVNLREYAKKGGPKTDIETIRKNFLKATQSINIPDSNISVQGYQGWDGNYWWYNKNKKKNPDMMAGITYQVKLSTTKQMDELVSKLDDEATEGFSIAKVSHSRLQEFKKQLKIQAIKSAKDKAIYLAEAIGEKVGEALYIKEIDNSYQQPVYMEKMMMMANSAMDGGGGTPSGLDFQKIKIRYEVMAQFAIK